MVTIGKIIATHGVRGEVKVASYSDVPGRFENLKQVQVEVSSGARTLEVLGSRRTAQGYLLHFADIATPEAASPLIGGQKNVIDGHGQRHALGFGMDFIGNALTHGRPAPGSDGHGQDQHADEGRSHGFPAASR